MTDLNGTVIPLPTPFDESGEVDESTFRQIIDVELNAHVDGIMVAGSYGQGPVMRPDQRMRAAETAVNEVRRLVEAVPAICGVKLAWGTAEEAASYVNALKGYDFGVFPGTATEMIAGAQVGARGTFAPLASLFPELCVDLWKAAINKEGERAIVLQEKAKKLNTVLAELVKKVGRTAFKEFYRIRGINMTLYPRWPAQQLSEVDRAALRAKVAEAGWQKP
jgi:dihydrodipicolinate synthase/N-acetylneuraminate lyase